MARRPREDGGGGGGARARKAARVQPAAADGGKCCVCFEEGEEGAWCGEAPGAHWTCAECLSQHVRHASEYDERPRDVAARSARVFCPKRHFGSTAAPECQAGPFEDVVLARCCSAEAFGAYVEASKRLACDKEHARFHRDVLLPIAQQLGDTSHRVLKETLRTQLPNAHMCGRKDPVTGELACMFGPVMHTNCSNLAAHDGERMEGSGARVSNRCARCGWRSR